MVVVLLAFALNAFLVLWLLDVSFYDYTQRETDAQLPIDTQAKTLDGIIVRLLRRVKFTLLTWIGCVIVLLTPSCLSQRAIPMLRDITSSARVNTEVIPCIRFPTKKTTQPERRQVKFTEEGISQLLYKCLQ
jgi:hypothetical protein